MGKAMVAAMSDEMRIANCMLRVIIYLKRVYGSELDDE